MRPGARLAPSDGPSLSAALQSTAPSRIERAPAVASTQSCTIRSTSLAPLPTRESSFASASPLRKDAIAINSINAESSARRRPRHHGSRMFPHEHTSAVSQRSEPKASSPTIDATYRWRLLLEPRPVDSSAALLRSTCHEDTQWRGCKWSPLR